MFAEQEKLAKFKKKKKKTPVSSQKRPRSPPPADRTLNSKRDELKHGLRISNAKISPLLITRLHIFCQLVSTNIICGTCTWEIKIFIFLSDALGLMVRGSPPPKCRWSVCFQIWDVISFLVNPVGALISSFTCSPSTTGGVCAETRRLDPGEEKALTRLSFIHVGRLSGCRRGLCCLLMWRNTWNNASCVALRFILRAPSFNSLLNVEKPSLIPSPLHLGCVSTRAWEQKQRFKTWN